MPLLAPGIGPLGFPELIILLVIVVLIFGVGRLPEVGGAIGKSIREFRKSTSEDADDAPGASVATSDVPSASGSDVVFCTECGAGNARHAKFCASCGHALEAKVG